MLKLFKKENEGKEVALLKQDHLHLNPWYEITLNTLAFKLIRDMKNGKQYRNIPFGHSLLDIKIEGMNTHIVYKTLIDGSWIEKETYDITENLSYHLQAHKFDSIWNETSHEAEFTPEIMKGISIAMADNCSR